MVDLLTAAVAGGKLLSAVIGVLEAASDGRIDKGKVKAWTDLVDGIKALWPQADRAESPPASLAAAASVAAFSAALSEHWAGNSSLAPDSQPSRLLRVVRLVTGTPVRELQVGLALHRALSAISDTTISQDPALFGDAPHGGSTYRSLWTAFVDDEVAVVRETLRLQGRDPDQPIQPLIDSPAASKTEFERAFRYHFRRICAPHAAVLRAFSDSLSARQSGIYSDLRLAAIAGWESASVFSRVSEQLRALTLGDIYVEPIAAQRTPPTGSLDGEESAERQTPALELLGDWLQDANGMPQVILGDFGLGKSLTAKTFACELAQHALASTGPSSDCWVPIYVPSGDVLQERAFDVDYVVRRANQLVLEDAGYRFAIDDSAVQPPDKSQRCVIILDGLDERALTQSELESLFRTLIDLSSAHRKFVVFSRPAIVEGVLDRFGKIAAATLRPFDTSRAQPDVPSRAERWLTRWNRLIRKDRDPVTIEAIASRGLLAEASTPIVLFVIAFAWDDDGGTPQRARASLYEKFLRRVARGKLPETGQPHPTIDAAAKKLHENLRALGKLRDEDGPEDALLWVLSALAWQSHCHDQTSNERAYTRADAEEFFRGPLRFREFGDRIYELIVDGVLLALQHSSRDGGARMLYGHKSFREYLVARYWNHQLRKVVDDADHLIWDSLSGGLLDVIQDATKPFLAELLDEWDDASLRALTVQSQRQFEDETVVSVRMRPCLFEDVRVELRHSALVVFSLARDALLRKQSSSPPVLTIRHSHQITSLFAGLLVKRPYLSLRWWLSGADLVGLDLHALQERGGYWFLQGARVRGCNLGSLRVWDGWCSDVVVENSQLDYCDVFRTDFNGAKFVGVYLGGAVFRDSFFVGAVFERCPVSPDNPVGFVSCRFASADTIGCRPSLPGLPLRVSVAQSEEQDSAEDAGASVTEYEDPDEHFFLVEVTECEFGREPDFASMQLRLVCFVRCQLRGANFRGADLVGASFTSCDLTGADFDGVDLSKVSFVECRGAPVTETSPSLRKRLTS